MVLTLPEGKCPNMAVVEIGGRQGPIIGTKREGASQAHSVFRDVGRHIFALSDCAHSYRATEVQDHHTSEWQALYLTLLGLCFTPSPNSD